MGVGTLARVVVVVGVSICGSRSNSSSMGSASRVVVVIGVHLE